MTDKRSVYERCVADLELARMRYKRAASRQQATPGEIQRVAIEAKRLEVKLAATKLAQAEYYLDALRARADHLVARVAHDLATSSEKAELEWAHGALPVNTATAARLADELAQRRQELNVLSETPLISADAAA
jgi:hypothetical protein